MRALAGEVLLAAWEDGVSAHELLRPLKMLSAVLADTDPADLRVLPIAERNLMLLRLHSLSFGPLLQIFGICPDCDAHLEFTVPVTEMTARVTAQSAAAPATWTENGRQYRLRAVTTDDLVATLSTADLAAAQELLLTRCLEVSRPATTELATRSDPPEVQQRFDELHAAAELTCAVECPSCSCRHVHDFDIARFLWAEVQNAARRLLGEIHELASAYGWSQQDIITMSATRRRAYLELLSA
jgi:hypothetical protein